MSGVDISSDNTDKHMLKSEKRGQMHTAMRSARHTLRICASYWAYIHAGIAEVRAREQLHFS